MSYLVTGFIAGLALIVAIGAQNAFLLRQGLRREHVLPLVAFCALADAGLIVAGVAGLGAIIEAQPVALHIIRYGGAAFLLYHGVDALRRMGRAEQMLAARGRGGSLKSALLTVAGFTFLNPHVYLDTVILLGALANQAGDGRWLFACGAAVASVVWFVGLGYGARLLAPIFARPAAWKLLDGFIALVMLALAATLLLTEL
jgi:L-lysine exporter family protein LysE/ArgO